MRSRNAVPLLALTVGWLAAAAQAAERPVTLPAGTRLPLALETAVSSATSQRGDLVVAKLRQNVRLNDEIVLPAGAELKGKVTLARPSGRVKGRARVAAAFDTLVVRGESHAIRASSIDVTAPDTHRRDAAIIAGSTIGGAIVGGIAKGQKGSQVGAAVGAGAGTGVVLTNKGKEVLLPAGTPRTVRLLRPVRLTGGIAVPPLTREP